MSPSRLQHTLDNMLGKRSRPRRTTSMMGMTDVVNMAAPPPPPRPQKTVIGGEPADFLQSCGLCNRRLAPGRDIYMYRGDTAFCSLECREQQMKQDERKERRAASTAKHGEGHRLFELAAAATETSGRTESLAAA